MADQATFEVDAGQILAKLHLAARNSVKQEAGAFFVNSGIVNDSASAKPENPGNVTFDLANKSNEYQIGYVTTIEYHKGYGIDDMFDALVDLLAKTSGDSSKLSDDAKSKKKDYEKLETSKKQLVNVFSQYSIDVSTDEMEDASQVKKLKEKLVEVNKKDKEDYDKTIDSIKKDMVEKLYGYLKVFAGVENVKTFDANSIGMLSIASDIKGPADKRLVKDFAIQEMSKQDKDKLVAQFRANFEKSLDDSKPQLNCKQKVCFYVKYTLNIDK